MKNLINEVIQGDALTVLKTLLPESVDMCITSPPYWALRDYGVEGQLGLEPTFQEYITNLCDIFDEVKRVLKKEGTCWVNMGDTYGGSGGYGGNTGFSETRLHQRIDGSKKQQSRTIAPKCLLQIPSRLSIEMCNRGWILRNTIIWYKPNCMPSSAKDRFTVDFEYLYFFVKQKKYYFEQQFDPSIYPDDNRKGRVNPLTAKDHQSGGNKIAYGNKTYPNRNKRCVWKIPTQPYSEAHFATYPEALITTPIKAGCPEGGIVLDPFFGAGTTALVARKLNRNYLGIELNEEYIKIARRRLQQEYLKLGG
jgi:DNA modification methylase